MRRVRHCGQGVIGE
ncbi:unnamed protein product, partial [Didymodactylos carnosus]